MQNSVEQPAVDSPTDQIIVSGADRPDARVKPLANSSRHIAEPQQKQGYLQNVIHGSKLKQFLCFLRHWPLSLHSHSPKLPVHQIQQGTKQRSQICELSLAKPPNRFRHYLTHPKTILAFCTVSVMAMIGIGIVTYIPKSTTKFNQNPVAGVVIDNLDEPKALKKLNEVSSNQQITISIDGKPYTFSAKELGINRDLAPLVESNFSKPQSKLEQVFIKQQKISSIKTYVNQNKLISSLESKLGQYKLAEDATVSVEGESVIVHPSKPGMNINFSMIASQIIASKISDNPTIVAELVKNEPLINTTAANIAKSQADEIISKAYGAGNQTRGIRFASKAQKATWLIFNNNTSTKTIEVAINIDSAKKTLTQIVNSFESSAKESVTLSIDGVAPLILEAGHDGVQVNQNSFNEGLKQLGASLLAHQSYTVNVDLAVEPGPVRSLGSVSGGKFILVDIPKFKAYAVENSTTVKTMLVSTGTALMPTPSGHFKIRAKVPMKTMTGCNSAVGCWDVPNVPNVQFFSDEGAAFHGTYWHNQFGVANLSHGCINLSLDDAAWLYGWTQVGTDVIVVR